jgi:two-component system, NtrC family, sensor kinase
MFKYRPSVRQKITFGYYAVVAMIVGFSIFTFIELRLIDTRIISGEAISDFINAALEIRRFEKNYFLYGKDLDYREAVQYVAKAEEILNDNRAGFVAVTDKERITALQNDLQTYAALMKRYAVETQKTLHRTVREDEIRKTGKEITTTAEEISKNERKNLQLHLDRYQQRLFLSILALSLFAIAIGQVLSRMVVKPLKTLEQRMGVIAAGTFQHVSIDSKDREIVSLTNAFNKMLKELEWHERHLIRSEKLASLGTLLSGVAHELNNPLSNISSSNQILMEEIDDGNKDYQKELISQINEQTDRARNIVRSLLDFSRDREFKKEPLLLKKLLEETIQFIKGQVPTKITVTLSVADDIMIVADKQRIQQAFLNLIKNAIDAIPAETGAVDIRAARRRSLTSVDSERAPVYHYVDYQGSCALDEDAVDIEIRDTGSGIPPAILQKIFDPFFTTKDVGKGSGLGLFIVHEIITQHDGCIAVDSEPNKGTTFLVRLPVREPEKKAS